MLKFKNSVEVTCNNVEEIAIVPGECCCSCCVSISVGIKINIDSNHTPIYVILK